MEFQRELAFRFPLTRGEDVRAVQLALTALRVTPPCGTVDGIYGHATRLSVEAFQLAQRLVVDGVVGPLTWNELMRVAAEGQAASPVLKRAAAALPTDRLPLSQRRALQAYQWLMDHFGPAIGDAIKNSPVDEALVGAIVCKETASVWLGWIPVLSPSELLARCVFDASGDMPGYPRSRFPKNTAEFRQRYGSLTDILIDEANQTRRLRQIPTRPWLYKGYGLLQYDLQNIQDDEEFFRKKLWYDIGACLDRFMRIMNDKLKAAHGDLETAVGLYNGRGARADRYRQEVLTMRGWLGGKPIGAAPAASPTAGAAPAHP